MAERSWGGFGQHFPLKLAFKNFKKTPEISMTLKSIFEDFGRVLEAKLAQQSLPHRSNKSFFLKRFLLFKKISRLLKEFFLL